MKLNKEGKERYYFDLFRKHYPLPNGIVDPDDKPDVILHGERRIGIEITNFYLEDGSSPASRQVQEILRDQVVSDAQAIYRRTNGGDCHLTVGFDESAPIRNKKTLASKIADLAVRIGGRQPGEVERDFFRDIPELSFAWLNVGNREDSWRIVQVYSGSMMSLEKLKDIIKEKELKSREYKPCDAYWLLVVVDFFDRAQDQEIGVEGFDAIRSEVFEKIFVYKPAFQQVLETSGGVGFNRPVLSTAG